MAELSVSLSAVLQPVVQLQEGTAIQLAEAGEALELPEGYAEGSSQLLLSATLLTAELALLQKSFNVNIQDKTVSCPWLPMHICAYPLE